jgi:hypothetical protein
MTLDEILAGPVADRHPQAPHDLTEGEARANLLMVEKQMPKRRRGDAVAFWARKARRITPEARALYVAYARAYGVEP